MTVKRVAGPGSALKVRLVIDRVGDVRLRLSDPIADLLVRSVFTAIFPLIKPLGDDLISTAFTDIFNESFRNLDVDEFVRD